MLAPGERAQRPQPGAQFPQLLKPAKRATETPRPYRALNSSLT